MLTYEQFISEGKLTPNDLRNHNGYRITLFKTKISKGEEFETTIGKVKVKNIPNNIKILDDIANGIKADKFELEDGSFLSASNFIKTGEFGGQGEGNISGADWEKIIVVANNMYTQGMSKAEAIKAGDISTWLNKFDTHLETGMRIIENSKLNKVHTLMKHYGSDTVNITPEWEKYFIEMTGKSAPAATKTPKTDMYLVNKTNISLKKAGGSQLMSGSQQETLATLMFAYQNTPDSVKTKMFNKTFDDMISKVKQDFNKFKGIGSISDIEKLHKSGKSSPIIDSVVNQLNKNKDMTAILQQLVESPQFKHAMIKEAMTGNNKFQTEIAKATHIMIFDPSGAGVIKEIDDSLISSYANKTKFSIAMKTSAGTSSTALRAVTNENYSLLSESLEETINEMETLHEGLIKSIKMGISNIKDYVDNLIFRWFNKIKTMVTSSLSTLLNLIGVEFVVNDPEISFTI